ncbi:MAG: hypothetical protein F4246_07520 [Rhodothermaceae bacterium]|nr:hypothetical protein [Rhodothermaceae bacterium]MXX58358.1 hypothetical protein [Rhodothermaceae bacterium]MYD19091.1 hypothetical protein [Rhodothermaceae bacterium]MYD56845.1 hypothetical protein [Rhodothermaceae bacterium]MYI43435.1 hypothetical protein [Rhodothermaceae bacterium]
MVGIDSATDDIVDSLNFILSTPYAGENTRAVGFSSGGLLVNVGLYATADSFTVKKYTRGIVTSIDRDPTEIPDGFTRSQNKPNPFNPQTNIEFEMKNALDIFSFRFYVAAIVIT